MQRNSHVVDRKYFGRSVWEWLQLVIVPFSLVLITLLFGFSQSRIQQRTEDQRAELQREIENQRTQDAAVQAYLDQMTLLLVEHDLSTSPPASAERNMTRARTRTVLLQLDPAHKREVMELLVGACLVGTDKHSRSLFCRNRFGDKVPHIKLVRVDLKRADLTGLDLGGADLQRAKLRNANLTRTNLEGADLRGANLLGACFSDTVLDQAELSGAKGGPPLFELPKIGPLVGDCSHGGDSAIEKV